MKVYLVRVAGDNGVIVNIFDNSEAAEKEAAYLEKQAKDSGMVVSYWVDEREVESSVDVSKSD
jgi:hypothetical protein